MNASEAQVSRGTLPCTNSRAHAPDPPPPRGCRLIFAERRLAGSINPARKPWLLLHSTERARRPAPAHEFSLRLDLLELKRAWLASQTLPENLGSRVQPPARLAGAEFRLAGGHVPRAQGPPAPGAARGAPARRGRPRQRLERRAGHGRHAPVLDAAVYRAGGRRARLALQRRAQGDGRGGRRLGVVVCLQSTGKEGRLEIDVVSNGGYK